MSDSTKELDELLEKTSQEVGREQGIVDPTSLLRFQRLKFAFLVDDANSSPRLLNATTFPQRLDLAQALLKNVQRILKEGGIFIFGNMFYKKERGILVEYGNEYPKLESTKK